MELNHFKHPSHQHTLKLQERSGLFKCDACGIEKKDESYYCTVCSFWIHKTCGSLEKTFRHEEHPHPLSLAYCVPEEYQTLKLKCDICDGDLDPNYWVYHCGYCRYVIHLKCITSKSPEDESAEAKSGVICLPVEDLSSLIRHFLEQNKLPAPIELPETFKHFSHEHPLIRHNIEDNYSEMDEDDQETVCNGCAEPISGSCYGCAQCNFFIHSHCAQLPEVVPHPDHPLFKLLHKHSWRRKLALNHRDDDHKLSLNHRQDQFFRLSRCGVSKQFCNGFFYECKGCNFLLDIRSAILPTIVKHEAHRHQLVRNRPISATFCNACNRWHGDVFLSCKLCNYNLAVECATLPKMVRHRWDEHPLILSFPPFYYHPDKFICDICEDEIHPKFWLYHCRECNINSFHTYCVSRLGWHRNVKFGGTLQIDSHPHPLTFVREAKYKSSCDKCGRCLKGCSIFECKACYFIICQPCVCKLVDFRRKVSNPEN